MSQKRDDDVMTSRDTADYADISRATSSLGDPTQRHRYYNQQQQQQQRSEERLRQIPNLKPNADARLGYLWHPHRRRPVLQKLLVGWSVGSVFFLLQTSGPDLAGGRPGAQPNYGSISVTGASLGAHKTRGSRP